jgi:hypothetical protein
LLKPETSEPTLVRDKSVKKEISMKKPFGTLRNIFGHSIRAVILLGLTAASGRAWADDTQPVVTKPAPEPAPAPNAPNNGDLPPPTSSHDTQPEVATPGAPAEGVVEQAGAGGTTGYGRAGVLELGGSLGLQMATNLKEYNVSPTVGWFVADNFQLSGIMNLSHVATDTDSGTIMGLLVEPSYHLPFTRTAFGFLGLGMGASYVNGLGTGFAMAPRLGANMIVGRSGILTPSISWQYTTHDAMSSTENTTLVAVSSALRVNVGYTVMW